MRLIDADELLVTESSDGLLNANLCGLNDFVDIIHDAPTVDAVPVVRCGDCKKRNTIRCPLGDWTLPHDDDFCNYGSKKDVIMSDL